jgi:hypothetical protein
VAFNLTRTALSDAGGFLRSRLAPHSITRFNPATLAATAMFSMAFWKRVFWGVFVSVSTMGLRSVPIMRGLEHGGYVALPPPYVFGLRHGLHVLWVYASAMKTRDSAYAFLRIMAQVVKLQPGWHWPVFKFVGNYMRTPNPSIGSSHQPVSAIIQSAKPKPAAGERIAIVWHDRNLVHQSLAGNLAHCIYSINTNYWRCYGF